MNQLPPYLAQRVGRSDSARVDGGKTEALFQRGNDDVDESQADKALDGGGRAEDRQGPFGIPEAVEAGEVEAE